MSGARFAISGPDMAGRSKPRLPGRTRTITFRVSAAELNALQSAWESSGARSLSAFARDAALDRAKGCIGPSVSLSDGLHALTMSLAELDSMLVGASRKIRRVLDPSSRGATDNEETGHYDAGQNA